MNCWGFSHGLMDALARLFPATLSRIAADDPLKGEFHLPFAVNELLQAGKAEVRVLPSADRWDGVTYQEDLAAVQAAIAGLQKSGLYPEKLW